MVRRAYHQPQATAIRDDLGYTFQFFLRIRPILHSPGMHAHAQHAVGGLEK